MEATIPFGPRLIGETEKTLNALLRIGLADTALTEHHWVVLRSANLTPARSTADLIDTASGRTHLTEVPRLVDELTDRGLLADGRVTPAGTALLTEVHDRIRAMTAPVWRDLPTDDVRATERTLSTVLARANAALRAAESS